MLKDNIPPVEGGQAYSPNKYDRAHDLENKFRRRRAKKIPLIRINIRLKSIRKLIMARFDGPCPPHAAEFFFDATLPLLRRKEELVDYRHEGTCSRKWIELWAPCLLDKGWAWLNAKITCAETRWMTNDEIGELLCVELWEVETFGLRLIGVVDKEAAQHRAEEKKQAKRRRDRDKKRTDREAAGCKPRGAVSVKKLCRALGKSRSWYYKNKLHLNSSPEATTSHAAETKWEVETVTVGT